MDSDLLERAKAVRSRIEGDLLKQPGVTGVDVRHRPVEGKSTREVVIEVYVKDKSKAPALPAQVDGVPIVVIERRFELH
jgi:hypothetical protein